MVTWICRNTLAGNLIESSIEGEERYVKGNKKLSQGVGGLSREGGTSATGDGLLSSGIARPARCLLLGREREEALGERHQLEKGKERNEKQNKR